MMWPLRPGGDLYVKTLTRSMLLGGMMLAFAAPASAAVLFGANANQWATAGDLVTINQTTGAGTFVGDPVTSGGVTGIVFGASGVLYGTTINGSGSTSSLITIDPATGALVGTVGAIGISIGDLAYNPVTGSLYGIRSNADNIQLGGRLYVINSATGSAALVGDTGAGAGGGIAFTADGRLFQAAYHNSQFALNELNPATAAVISSVSLTHYFDGLAIRSDGVIFGTPGNSDAVYTISYTGAETLVGNTGTGFLSALAFQTPGFGRPRLPVAAPSVPEPATPGLVALALLAMGYLRRRSPLTGALQQFFQLLCRDGVGDAAWLGQGRFLGAFDKYAVQNADDFSGIGTVDRAAAVARIGRAVELEDLVGTCL